jgi:hypothetical protein
LVKIDHSEFEGQKNPRETVKSKNFTMEVRVSPKNVTRLVMDMAAPAKFRFISNDELSPIGVDVSKEGVLMSSHGTGIGVAIPLDVNGA